MKINQWLLSNCRFAQTKPWQMTLDEWKKLNNVQKESYQEAFNATSPIGTFPHDREKVVWRDEGAYSFTSPNGKKYVWDIVKTEFTPKHWGSPNVTRYLATAPGSDVPLAGLVINNRINQAVAAHALENKVGLMQELLRRAKKDFGSISGASPMSSQGAKMLHRFEIMEALKAGEQVSPEVLKDYPDLQGMIR